MLVRLDESRVPEYWDEVAASIADAFPPHAKLTEHSMNNILDSILNGALQVWILTQDNDEHTVLAIGTTQILLDTISGTKNLLIYSLKSHVDNVPQSSWKQGLDGLKQFCSQEGVHNICAYTTSPAIAKILRVAGAKKEEFYSLKVGG